MKALLMLLLSVAGASVAHGREAGSDTLQRSALVREALRRNPEIEAALEQMFLMDARVSQESSLPPPEIIAMREGMPGFRYRDAMFARIELMQMIPFPSKISGRRDIALIVADHAHHEHMEKVFAIVESVKKTYDELWYYQQASGLSEKNARLAGEFAAVARARYGAGNGGLQEVLKAELEEAKQKNQLEALRSEERGAKAMLMGLLNRRPDDTLGVAILADSLDALPPLDSLVGATLRLRPMLQHDSLAVIEQHAMRTLAGREYLPDFRIGLQYMTSPLDGFTGWTVTAGITIPFAPWAVGNASGKIEESEAGIARARAILAGSRAMVTASVRGLYHAGAAERRRLAQYRSSIIPRARQSLDAGIAAYQSGKADFLMILDSYRMVVELTMESIMLRMEYEQTIARLEREIGVIDLSRLVPSEGVTP